MKKEKMISAVKACLGTPFHHQGRHAQSGLDCIGLVIVGLKAAGVIVEDRFDYGMRPDGFSLIAALKAHGAQEVATIQVGDVLILRYENQPQHVAVALSGNSLIHSFAPAGKVVQSHINQYWHRRILAIYRFFENDGE